MFVSFLLPYPIRYAEAPYLWVYYKQLYSFEPDEIAFVGSADYFRMPEYYVSRKRWEVSDEYHPLLDYRVPFQSDIASSWKFLIDPGIFAPLERVYLSPNMVWKHLLTNDFVPLRIKFKEILLEILQDRNVEAIITLCNCPSIENAAAELGIPVIHNEIGPLRAPAFVSTAYFDFRGVNGNTESLRRLLDFRKSEVIMDHATSDTLSIVSLDIDYMETVIAAKGDLVGVALQLPDDSNTVAFSNGFNELELLSYAKHCFPTKELLIRAHPQQPLAINYTGYGALDKSATAAEFIGKCDVVFTINSSVGFEAMLMGRDVRAVGDSFYSFLADPRETNGLSISEMGIAQHFLTISYLIPYRNLFDPDYYRWRLLFPEEKEIYFRHLDLWQEARCIP